MNWSGLDYKCFLCYLLLRCACIFLDIQSLSADIIDVVRDLLVREGSVIKGYNSARGARNKKVRRKEEKPTV